MLTKRLAESIQENLQRLNSKGGVVMCREITRQEALRNSVTYNLFVDTADQNYVVARWCYQQRLELDFLWNAAHCLEKFMKAALLLNGRSAISRTGNSKPFGHDIELLYAELNKFAEKLLPDLLIKPNEIDIHWKTEPSVDFISRISRQGDAHNRYQIYGYELHREDLYKLDKMVFSIRRVCCPLDKYMFANFRQGQPKMTFRDQLTRQGSYMPRSSGSRWQKLTGQQSTQEVRFAALNHNMLFAEDSFEHGNLKNGISGLNSVLGREILRADEEGASGQKAKEAVELADWVVNNIFLPRPVKDQLIEARDRLSAQVGTK